MIRQARSDEKAIIYKLWKEAFSFDDGGSIDYYFEHYYKDSQSIVFEENGVIVSSLQSREKTLMLYGNELTVNYIVGAVTVSEYRNKGYMRKLLDAVLEYSSNHYLITLLQAYNPKIYEPFGFETIIENKETSIVRNQMSRINATGVTFNVKAEELLEVYHQFTQHFTGYCTRSVEDMELLIKGVHGEGGDVIGYYKDQKLISYAFMLYKDKEARLDEVCYRDSASLLKLISFGLQQREYVTLVSSSQEKIGRIIPGVQSKKVPFMMARVNQTELFEKLFRVRIISSYSAFNAFSVPLFNRDYL